jgi:hypothetical protein
MPLRSASPDCIWRAISSSIRPSTPWPVFCPMFQRCVLPERARNRGCGRVGAVEYALSRGLRISGHDLLDHGGRVERDDVGDPDFLQLVADDRDAPLEPRPALLRDEREADGRLSRPRAAVAVAIGEADRGQQRAPAGSWGVPARPAKTTSCWRA